MHMTYERRAREGPRCRMKYPLGTHGAGYGAHEEWELQVRERGREPMGERRGATGTTGRLRDGGWWFRQIHPKRGDGPKIPGMKGAVYEEHTPEHT